MKDMKINERENKWHERRERSGVVARKNPCLFPAVGDNFFCKWGFLLKNLGKPFTQDIMEGLLPKA